MLICLFACRNYVLEKQREKVAMNASNWYVCVRGWIPMSSLYVYGGAQGHPTRRTSDVRASTRYKSQEKHMLAVQKMCRCLLIAPEDSCVLCRHAKFAEAVETIKLKVTDAFVCCVT